MPAETKSPTLLFTQQFNWEHNTEDQINLTEKRTKNDTIFLFPSVVVGDGSLLYQRQQQAGGRIIGTWKQKAAFFVCLVNHRTDSLCANWFLCFLVLLYGVATNSYICTVTVPRLINRPQILCLSWHSSWQHDIHDIRENGVIDLTINNKIDLVSR